MLEPASFTGTRTRYTVERESDEAPPQFSDTLRLGRPADVTSGSPLIVLGWPSPDGQTSIFVDSTHECLAREGSIIRSRIGRLRFHSREPSTLMMRLRQTRHARRAPPFEIFVPRHSTL